MMQLALPLGSVLKLSMGMLLSIFIVSFDEYSMNLRCSLGHPWQMFSKTPLKMIYMQNLPSFSTLLYLVMMNVERKVQRLCSYFSQLARTYAEGD